MNSKLNPVSVGSFVIGGVILLAIGLMSFQSLSFIHKPIRFMSYFDESVQGMGVGSDVKLRGVLVGRVITIKIHYDWTTRKSSVAVVGELNDNAIIDHAGNIIKVTKVSILEQLVKDGLRAKIDLVGITGLQFIQLDFLDPNQRVSDTPRESCCYPVIPTVDSGMSKLTDNLVAIAENFRKIDFAKISSDFTKTTDELNTFLETLTKKAEDLDFKNLHLQKMASKITDAATSIQQMADFLEKNPSSLIFGRKK